MYPDPHLILDRLEALPARLRTLGRSFLLFGVGAAVIGFLIEPLYAVAGLVALPGLADLFMDARAMERHGTLLVSRGRALLDDTATDARWTVDTASWDRWIDYELARSRRLLWKVPATVTLVGAALGWAMARSEGEPTLLPFVAGFALLASLLVAALIRRGIVQWYGSMRGRPQEVRLDRGALVCGAVFHVWFDRVPFAVSVLMPHVFTELHGARLVDGGTPLLELTFWHRWWGLQLPFAARRVRVPAPRDDLERVRRARRLLLAGD